MTYTFATRFAPALLVAALLSACAGGGSGSDFGGGGGGGTIDQPIPPTATAAAIATTVNRIGAANAVPIPPSPALGSASYAGGLLMDATIDGVRGQKIFANIDASANVANGTFSGTVRNFHMVNASNVPTEKIGGSLNFNGRSNGVQKTVTATARGNLEGNFGGDTKEIVNMSIDLDGRVRGPNIFDNMSTLNGSVTGGSAANQPINVQIDGDFYLRDDL